MKIQYTDKSLDICWFYHLPNLWRRKKLRKCLDTQTAFLLAHQILVIYSYQLDYVYNYLPMLILLWVAMAGLLEKLVRHYFQIIFHPKQKMLCSILLFVLVVLIEMHPLQFSDDYSYLPHFLWRILHQDIPQSSALS